MARATASHVASNHDAFPSSSNFIVDNSLLTRGADKRARSTRGEEKTLRKDVKVSRNDGAHAAFQLHPRHTCLSFILRYALDRLSKKRNHALFLAPFFINCSCWHIHASSVIPSSSLILTLFSLRTITSLSPHYYLFISFSLLLFLLIEQFSSRSLKNLKFLHSTYKMSSSLEMHFTHYLALSRLFIFYKS